MTLRTFRRMPWTHIGVLTIILYFIDKTFAALDGYVPGEDYPVYTEVPKGLSFTCDDKIPGYYADPETQCQVWHWCVPSIGGNVMYSFICGPGTVFNQRTRVCDWFFKVDCPNAQAYYGINDDLYKDESGNYIMGKKTWRSKDRFRRLSSQTESRKRKNFVCEKKNCYSAFKNIAMRNRNAKAAKLNVTSNV